MKLLREGKLEWDKKRGIHRSYSDVDDSYVFVPI